MTICNFFMCLPNNTVSLIGILTNILNIVFLVRKQNKLDFAKSFTNLLVLLSVYDLIHLLIGIVVFVLPELSTWYSIHVYPHVLPIW